LTPNYRDGTPLSNRAKSTPRRSLGPGQSIDDPSAEPLLHRSGAKLSSVSKASVTEHENPMYKPPPPLDASATKSPRPMRHAPLPGQRQPPPYVPP